MNPLFSKHLWKNCWMFLETNPSVQVASLMQVMKDKKNIEDPNYVKVAVDLQMNALFFSRSVIPFPRDQSITSIYYEHIGVYAFRKQALMQFTAWPVTPLGSSGKNRMSSVS